MALTDVKVELELDTTNFTDLVFILDDPVQGVLDNTVYKLGGIGFYDVSNYFISMSVDRGKSRLLDEYDAGSASVRFDNSQRAFDPRYEPSPFFGSIVPRLPIRISVNENIAFTGVVRDWNLDYDPGNQSIATAVCSDNFTILAQNEFEIFLNVVEQSGERVTSVLDRTEVDWSPTLRNIDTGKTEVSADTNQTGDNVLAYLNTIAQTEQGQLFMAKDGKVTFYERSKNLPIKTAFADDGTGIAYKDIKVVYGSELLYNRINISPDGLDTETADNSTSIAAYGLSVFDLNTIHESGADAANAATILLAQYSEPEFRVEQITIDLSTLSLSDQNTLAQIELADLVTIKFTPSGIPPAFEIPARVIGIEHDAEKKTHDITFRLATLTNAMFILGNEGLGVLGDNVLGYD